MLTLTDEQHAALRGVNTALCAATSTGALDVLSNTLPLDTINNFCDAVADSVNTDRTRVCELRNDLLLWAIGRRPLTLADVQQRVQELDTLLQQFDF